MLIVIPTGGLGNRLMAMMSAKLFAEHIGCGFQVSWNAEPWLPYSNCPITGLFEGFESVPMPDINAPGISYVEHHIPGPRPELEERLKAGETIYMRSYCFIRPQGMAEPDFMAHIHREFGQLKPLPELIARVPQLPAGTIGVQIRGRDNWRATRYSPLSLFFKVMDRHCHEDAGATFYVSSDSPRVRRLVRKRYGSRIHRDLDQEEWDEPGALTRRGLVKLLALSRTSRIYHSVLTSFSFISHLISRMPFICVGLKKRPAGFYDSAADKLHDQLLEWDVARMRWRKIDLAGAPMSRRLMAEWMLCRARFACSKAFQLWPLHQLGPLD